MLTFFLRQKGLELILFVFTGRSNKRQRVTLLKFPGACDLWLSDVKPTQKMYRLTSNRLLPAKVPIAVY